MAKQWKKYVRITAIIIIIITLLFLLLLKTFSVLLIAIYTFLDPGPFVGLKVLGEICM